MTSVCRKYRPEKTETDSSSTARESRRKVRPPSTKIVWLFERFASRGESDFARRLLSAMRKEFGGHAEQIEAAAG